MFIRLGVPLSFQVHKDSESIDKKMNDSRKNKEQNDSSIETSDLTTSDKPLLTHSIDEGRLEYLPAESSF